MLLKLCFLQILSYIIWKGGESVSGLVDSIHEVSITSFNSLYLILKNSSEDDFVAICFNKIVIKPSNE